MKLLLSLILTFVLSGCDIPRPSDVICDCRMRPDSELSEWSRLDKAPPNFVHDEIRQLLHDPESAYLGTPEVFDSASIHWYQNDAGESLACVVFDESHHVRAMFTLAADSEQTAPTDYRLMGIPLVGHQPFFWEGCREDE
ncbi:MAG: hypothetical protein AAFM91_03200 [Pseudomonadota bacterium]